MENILKNSDVIRTIANVLLIIGSVISLAGAAILWDSYRQLQWKPVDAEILSSQLVVGGSLTQKNTYWKLLIKYRYSFGGKEYVSDFFTSSTPPSSPARGGREPSPEMLALVEKYKTGKTVKAFVSETAPQKAVVIRPERPLYVVFVLGLTTALLGIWLRRI